MEKRVIKIEVFPAGFPSLPKAITKKKVAAYARVSTSSEEQLNSVDAQKSYYENLIINNPEWTYAGLYADEGISGLSSVKRESFNRMIKDALNGEIDLIITKSLSRFARNTVDTLTYIRKLKEKGVAVYFEKEDINTMDAKGEFMITLLSSMAQEEARSISENVKWGMRKRMADGKYYVPYSQFLGYKKGYETLEIVPQEAWIVRYIYYLFVCGKSPYYIVARLTELGIPSPSGLSKWRPKTVENILSNEKYCGNALLQKKYVVDYLTKKEIKNNGELPQYFVENGHPPIVDVDVWNEVQNIRQKRNIYLPTNPLSQKLFCSNCGRNYLRKIRHDLVYKDNPAAFYECKGRYAKEGKCKNSVFYEPELKELFSTAVLQLFDKHRSSVRKMLNTAFKDYQIDRRIRFPLESILSPSANTKLPQGSLEILISKAAANPDNSITFEMLNGEVFTVQGQHRTPKRRVVSG